MERRTLLLALVAVLVTISGCAQIESTARIGEDGEIEHYEMDMQFSDEAWGMLEQFADAEGYDSVEQWLLEDSEEDDDAAIECTEGAEEVTVDEDGQSVHLECTDPVIRNESAVNLTVQDDGISYYDTETTAWDQNLNGTEDMGLNVDEMEFTFTLVFPSEVTSSNADVVNGNEATWHMTEFEGGALEAHTGSASGTTGDDGDTTDGSGDGTDDGDTTDGSGDGTDDGDTTDDSSDDSTDDSTDSTGEEGGADDSSGGDETESGTDGSDGDGDGSSGTVDDEDGDTEDSDGSGPSGFTLAGVVIALAALVGFGLRRRH